MKVLIISYGSIGKRHYNILNSLNKNIEISVVSSQTINNSIVYNSIQKAYQEHQFNYTIICSPTSRHYIDLLEVLKFHTIGNPILIEKPVFEKYISKIDLKSKNIFVGYNLRYHPIINKLREILKNTKDINYVNMYVGQYLPNWRPERDYRESYSSKKEEGGGVLLDLSHEIDLLHYLFGEIQICNSLVSHQSNLEINSEDVALIHGKTVKNIIFSLSLDYISKTPIRQITVHSNSKTYQADLIQNTLYSTNLNGQKEYEEIKDLDRNHTYTQMHKELIESNFSNICSFEDGLKVNYWIDQIKKNSI